jgi:NADPH-dependent glutamate synthase beta subunit-like oxidoreductase
VSSTKYKVELADVEYWQKQIKCQWGCPVHTDSRGYVLAIAEGRYLDAYRIARGPNPFASICGRVCGAPCEMACRRGTIDESVTIRALKRYVTEKHGVEAVDPAGTVEFSTARRDANNPRAGARVAVIGAGVAGLTAAHDLALLGYKVTVFEREEVAGGMLVTGVPIYRLPRELVQAEIDAILSLGVELKLGVNVGDEVTVDSLREEGFEAILIAAGLQNSRKLPLEGADLPGVLHGIEFLRLVNLGQTVDVGEKVVVIGGGNVAFDVARTAVRGTPAEAKDFYQAADTARMALRQGVKEVHLVCLESREEMPADDIEVEEGEEEGITLHTSRGPLKIVEKDGRVGGLATRRVLSVFDEEGNFNPHFSQEPGETIDVDTVIFSVGQSGDFGFLGEKSEVKISDRGTIEIDLETKCTSVPDIFACGDVADGAALFINAIRSAQIAAVSIDKYLRQQDAEEVVSGRFDDPGRHEGEMSDGYLQRDRQLPEALDAHTRSTTLELVELPYAEEVAREQGDRCLKCHINTIFNGESCILCNGCVDVCPTACLALVPLDQIALEPRLEQALEKRYGVDVKTLTQDEGPAAVRRLGSAMIKDEDRCIRCGYCARRCPTGAVTMEHFQHAETLDWK